MKKLVAVLAGFVLAFVVFYFWASSTNWSAENYNNIVKFEVEPKAEPGDTLSVMTYNIGWLSGMTNNLPVPRTLEMYEQNQQRAIQFIDSLHPNLIGFQEIDLAAKRSFYFNQPDSIALGAHYVYGALAVNWDKKYVPFPYWPFQYHFGRLISGQYVMSDFSIEKSEIVVLPKPVNAPFYYNAFYLDRLIQKVWVNTSKGQLLVMNVHLEAFDQETRILHVDRVIEEYLKYADQLPVLLIGDFNSRAVGADGPLDESARRMYDVPGTAMAINDSLFALNPDKNYTFSSGEPLEKIDYIFYNTRFIEKVQAKVMQEIGGPSDHFPVWMQFVLK